MEYPQELEVGSTSFTGAGAGGKSNSDEKSDLQEQVAGMAAVSAPKVFIVPSGFEETSASNLRDIVVRNHGKLVDDIDAADIVIAASALNDTISEERASQPLLVDPSYLDEVSKSQQWPDPKSYAIDTSKSNKRKLEVLNTHHAGGTRSPKRPRSPIRDILSAPVPVLQGTTTSVTRSPLRARSPIKELLSDLSPDEKSTPSLQAKEVDTASGNSSNELTTQSIVNFAQRRDETYEGELEKKHYFSLHDKSNVEPMKISVVPAPREVSPTTAKAIPLKPEPTRASNGPTSPMSIPSIQPSDKHPPQARLSPTAGILDEMDVEEEEEEDEEDEEATNDALLLSSVDTGIASGINDPLIGDQFRAKEAHQILSGLSQRPSLERTRMSYTSLVSAAQDKVPGYKTDSLADRQKRKTVVVPGCASWFSLTTISPIEERMLPEFFTGTSPSKTREVYLKYRNYMINAYRQDPETYLSATACRRGLSGDACAILRVHEFLEHWGLINFNVDPLTRPFGPHVAGLPSSTVRGLLYEMPTVKGSKRSTLNVEPHETFNIHDDNTSANQRSCAVCKADCTRLSYAATSEARARQPANFHTILQPGTSICSRCYTNAKYPPYLSSKDFVRRENLNDTKWTTEELLKLLEALEFSIGDENVNWEAVAENVGTKNAHECVLKFLQLPIEEPILEEYRKQTVGPDKGADGRVIPFGDMTNPVMAQIAFLVAHVHPEVAAAAAQAALKEIIKQHGANTGGAGSTPRKSGGSTPGATPRKSSTSTSGKVTPKTASKPIAKAGSVGWSKLPPTTSQSPASSKVLADQGDSGSIRREVSDDEEAPLSAVAAAITKAAGHTAEKPSDPHLKHISFEATAAAALAAAAVRAKAIAEREEQEIHRLVLTLVEKQLKKIDLKIKQFDTLETLLQQEREQLEKERMELISARLKDRGINPDTMMFPVLAAEELEAAPADDVMAGGSAL